MNKPVLTITQDDIKLIKNAAFNHIHDTYPKNLDETELQILLICKGVFHFLGYKGTDLPNIEYDWEKCNVTKY